MLDIARRHNQGYNDIKSANPAVDLLLPGEDTPVLIPSLYILPETPRQGLIINLAELRLYFFPPVAPGEAPQVVTYPIGIGKRDHPTPRGALRAVNKLTKPTWYVPASIRDARRLENPDYPAAIPPGPDNPLGEFALLLSRKRYLLHGTNKPDGIGMHVSNGCIRLYPEHIAELFKNLPLQTPVQIVSQPYKVGWRDDTLYLEVHPDHYRKGKTRDLSRMVKQIVKATTKGETTIDWPKVDRLVESADGIPGPIGQRQRHAGDLAHREN